MDRRTCTFCSAAAALAPTEECSACWSCAKRVARLASAGAADVWPAPSAEPDPDFDQLAADVARAIPPSDHDSHYNLAQAYRAMTKHGEAVREAAIALAAAKKEVDATLALRLLLSPPLLRERGLEHLRRKLTGN